MATETIELRFLAELGDLRKELSKMPDIGDKEAKKLVSALEKQYKQAANAAKKMANDTKAEAEKTAKALEGTKNVAEGLGGAFGATAGQVEKMVQAGVRLSASVGPLPAALGAATVGIGIMTAATVGAAQQLFEFIDGADAAIERLGELSGVAPLPPATVQALDAWGDGALAAEAAGARLHAIVAGELAEAFGDLPGYLVLAADKLGAVAQAAGDVREDMEILAPALRGTLAVLTFGASELGRWALGADEMGAAAALAATGVADLTDALELANDAAAAFAGLQEEAILAMTGATSAQIAHFKALEAVDAAAQKAIATNREAVGVDAAYEAQVLGSAEAIKRLKEEEFQAADAKRQSAEASKAAAAAARQETENAADVNESIKIQNGIRESSERAVQTLADLTAQLSADEMTREEQIQAAYEQRNELIREQMQLTGDYGAIKAAQDANDLQRTQDLATLEKERAAQLSTDAEQFHADAQGIQDSLTAMLQDWKAQQLANVAAVVQAVGQIGESLMDIHQSITGAQIDMLGEQAEAQSAAADEAVQAWREQQEDYVQKALEAGSIDQATAAARMKQIEAEAEAKREALDAESEEIRKRQLDLWKQGQKLAAAMVPVHVAEGLLKSTATLGPPIPPNIVGIAGAAAVLAGGVAEGVAIATAKPPAFPMGGLVQPDHQVATIAMQDGEEAFITNRRGTDRLRRANEGRMDGQPIVINLGRRTLATAVGLVGAQVTADPRRGTRDPWGR